MNVETGSLSPRYFPLDIANETFHTYTTQS